MSDTFSLAIATVGALFGAGGLTAFFLGWLRERRRDRTQILSISMDVLDYTRGHYERLIEEMESRCRLEIEELKVEIRDLRARLEPPKSG